MLKLLLALSLAILPLHSAYADRGHRDRGRDQNHHRHYGHDRPRSSVSINFGYVPYYPPYYYYHRRPARLIYAPPPPILQQDVIYINNSNSREIDSTDGRYCREYTTRANIGGRMQETYGTACMQADGSWEIIN